MAFIGLSSVAPLYVTVSTCSQLQDELQVGQISKIVDINPIFCDIFLANMETNLSLTACPMFGQLLSVRALCSQRESGELFTTK